MREVVLDTESGLPEVRASRSEDGQLRFRYHTIRPGGMSVWETVTDEVLRRMSQVDRSSFEAQIKAAQLQIAREVAERAHASERETEGLRERLDAAEALLAEADARIVAAEQRADEAERKARAPRQPRQPKAAAA